MGTIPKLSIVKGETFALTEEGFLHRLFEKNAAAYPSSVALLYKGLNSNVMKEISFSTLNQKANSLARCLLTHMLKTPNSEGDYIIAVNLLPSDDLLITLLAIWKCGAAYLPLDNNAPSSRVKHILTESKPALIVTQEEDDMKGEAYKGHNAHCFHTLNAEAINMTTSNLSDKDMLAEYREALAIVLYTSGSTGVPKGVRLPHKVVLNRLRWQWREFPFSTTEHVCVFKTTMTFVDAVAEIWGPLLHANPRKILVVSKEVTKDPQRLISLLEEYKVERLVLVPTLLRSILLYLNMETEKQLQNLKIWVCSGEPLPVSLAEQFLKYFSSSYNMLCNFYGSTEIMGDVTYHVITSHEDITFKDKVPIGLPVDNTVIYLLDKNLQPVPVGELGEIFVAGLNVCAGYVNNRDADRFIPNSHVVDPDLCRLYRTGDYGRLIKGAIIYEGRTDSQVKVRGNRVDLAEIDAALGKMSGIHKNVVLCYKPGEIEQAIIAYVTLKPETKVSAQEIETRLKSTLPPYAIPQVLLINNIPLLNNGKVDRQTLLRQYDQLNSKENNVDIDYESIPDDKIDAAKCLLRTIGKVLAGTARNKISLNSNFYYHLGGNSLNSVLAVSKLRDQGYYIGITDFISADTLWDVLRKLIPEEDIIQNEDNKTSQGYVSELITDKCKSEVYKIITDSFYEKGDLEKWIVPRFEDYYELLDLVWKPMVEAKLSFVLRSLKTGKIEGVSLNFDAHNEPPVTINGPLATVLTFLEYVEAPIRDNKLPKGKQQILHTFMMGTEKSLSAAENVAIIQAMEEEVLKLAKKRGFAGIFTSNTSPLTQQLGTDVFKYTVMDEIQVNAYVAPDGSKPFSEAPDYQTVSCSWKQI